MFSDSVSEVNIFQLAEFNKYIP